MRGDMELSSFIDGEDFEALEEAGLDTVDCLFLAPPSLGIRQYEVSYDNLVKLVIDLAKEVVRLRKRTEKLGKRSVDAFRGEE